MTDEKQTEPQGHKGYQQAEQHTHCGSPRRRKEKKRQRDLKKLWPKTSQC